MKQRICSDHDVNNKGLKEQGRSIATTRSLIQDAGAYREC